MSDKRYKVNDDAILCNWPVDGTVFTHLNTGQRIFLDNRDLSIFTNVLETRSWEPQTWEVIDKVLTKDSVFVDIGANIGIHSVYASRITHNIYDVEAMPRTFKILQQNLFMNGVFNAKIFNLAVSDSRKTVKFSNMVAAGAGFNGLTSKQKNLFEKGSNSVIDTVMSIKEEISVKTDLLQNLIDKNIAVDLLKIDVEGAELDILESSTDLIERSPNLNIILETPSVNTKAYQRLINLIKKFDFDIKIVRYLKSPEKACLDSLEKKLIEGGHGDLWLSRR